LIVQSGELKCLAMSVGNLIKTVSRAAKMGKIAHAARRAKRSEGDARHAARRTLANLLADARGIPMKIGQILAERWREDDAFDPLVTSIDPKPLEEMIPSLDETIGDKWQTVFAHIDESEAAASLGQVHKASLLDGTVVAVKLQYPDIASAVEAELKLVGLLPGVGPAKKWGMDLGAYKQMLKSNMDRELNYLGEADRQMTYAQRVNVSGLVVPRVFHHLCRDTVLVQSWEQGETIQTAADWPQPVRTELASVLISTFFKSLFVAGTVHADPHPGNVRFRNVGESQAEVVQLDYGCTVEIDETAQLAMLKLIIGCRNGDDTDPLRCLAAMGFDVAKLAGIADTVPALCLLLCEPFKNDTPFSTKYWELSERIEGLLGDLRWWFRSAGPAHVLLLLRAFGGLVNQMETLKTVQPWWIRLVEAVGQDRIDQAIAFELPPLDSELVRQATAFNSVATTLNITVTEEGKKVVSVTLPASQTPFIRSNMTDEVVQRIEQQGVDIDAIVTQACNAGLVPGTLFDLKIGLRDYKIWLQ
jgi:predicted unusual protein kinase regulating ubiquinone biosynthesis (AarF/ABC1/UbiB family)